MKRKLAVLAIIAALMLVVFPGCSAGGEEYPEPPEEELLLTLEELSAFDGRDGRPAYVAVDGIIYDMSDSTRWPVGNHNGFQAGQDLTDAIRNESPHGEGNLSRVPQIGRIVE